MISFRAWDAISEKNAEITRLRGAITKLAAECHRAKWQFDLNEDYGPSPSAARALIARSFDELHRIGDLAMKLRAQTSSIDK